MIFVTLTLDILFYSSRCYSQWIFSEYRTNLYSNVNDFPPSDSAVLSPDNLQVPFYYQSYKVISTASMSHIHAGNFWEAEVRIIKLHVLSYV